MKWLPKNCLRVVLIVQAVTDEAGNNVYQSSFDYFVGAGLDGDLTSFLATVGPSVESSSIALGMANAMGDTMTLTGYRLYARNSDGDMYGLRGSFSSPLGGNIADAVNDGGLSACVTLRTARLGRKYRGRRYVPGVKMSTTAEGVIHSSQLAALTTFAGNCVENQEWALLASVAVLVHPGDEATYTPLTLGEAQPIARYIRRRQSGKGS